MRIGIIAKAKQGDIMEALENRGWTQGKGAEFLGMDQSTFGRLLNLKWVPEEFSPKLTIKLFELTGKTPEELFPDWARQKDFLRMPKVSKKILEVTPQMLGDAGALYLPAGPEEAFCKQDVEKVINDVLHTLSPREEQIIRRHIMEDETLDKIGEDFAVSGQRIGEIYNKALAKMRHPVRARVLRGCLAEISG
jgi:RNA polymerase sigma factor (sigma-70 family)